MPTVSYKSELGQLISFRIKDEAQLVSQLLAIVSNIEIGLTDVAEDCLIDLFDLLSLECEEMGNEDL